MVLQIGHAASVLALRNLRVQAEHMGRWPQGTSKMAAGASRQATHSSSSARQEQKPWLQICQLGRKGSTAGRLQADLGCEAVPQVAAVL